MVTPSCGSSTFRTVPDALATPWGSRLTLPDVTSFDPLTALLSAAAGLALMRLKANVLLVILACAAMGLLRGLLA
jgi:hypothetical protein